MAMIETDKLINKDPQCANARLLLQIHDELLFEVDDENLDYVCKHIQTTVESVVKLDVELPVRISIGTSWGALKQYSPPN